MAVEFGLRIGEFFREPSGSYAAEIREAYARIDAWQPEAILELHFNAGGGTGTEMLYWHSSSAGSKLAGAVQDAVVGELGLYSRGLRPRADGERGSTSLKASRYPTILCEPFFAFYRPVTRRMLPLNSSNSTLTKQERYRML